MNLIKHQRPNIDNIYLYVKHSLESKYQFLINGREKVGIKILKNPSALIDYWQTIDDVYENLEDYNPKKKRIELIVFDDIIVDIWSNKKWRPIVTELFLKEGQLSVSLVFYIKILFQSAQNYKTRYNTLFYHKYS